MVGGGGAATCFFSHPAKKAASERTIRDDHARRTLRVVEVLAVRIRMGEPGNNSGKIIFIVVLCWNKGFTHRPKPEVSVLSLLSSTPRHTTAPRVAALDTI